MVWLGGIGLQCFDQLDQAFGTAVAIGMGMKLITRIPKCLCPLGGYIFGHHPHATVTVEITGILKLS